MQYSQLRHRKRPSKRSLSSAPTKQHFAYSQGTKKNNNLNNPIWKLRLIHQGPHVITRLSIYRAQKLLSRAGLSLTLYITGGESTKEGGRALPGVYMGNDGATFSRERARSKYTLYNLSRDSYAKGETRIESDAGEATQPLSRARGPKKERKLASRAGRIAADHN